MKKKTLGQKSKSASDILSHSLTQYNIYAPLEGEAKTVCL